ncbi:hypothetical protein CYJ32_07405 [Alloscardovia omnicolens]|uniref:Uncharacterized protein n=1 Tax=Alloscardovia omnicolens TaxID=419015 RepID=A0A2I1M1M6_9BIFI|nr:hypothetical protein CYJ32_07405 [Alloscardovia omnicolens]
MCPVCGLDPEFCHDKDKVKDIFAYADIETCYVGVMREERMRAYQKNHKDDDAPNSRLTRLVPYEYEIVDDDK